MNLGLLKYLCDLRNKASAEKWFTHCYEGDYGHKDASIGPRAGETYEDTIATFYGSEHDAEANATLVVALVNNIERICEEFEKVGEFITGLSDIMSKDHIDFDQLQKLLDNVKSERGFKIIKPDSDDQVSPRGNPRIFLAGSIDNGKAINWQPIVEERLADFPVTIFNPRRNEWNPDLIQDISDPVFNHQVNWELDHIEEAEILFVNFDPNGPAPITLMELGHAKSSQKVIVCCPDGYWRKGNVQIMCHRKNFVLFDDLTSGMDYLVKSIEMLSS